MQEPGQKYNQTWLSRQELREHFVEAGIGGIEINRVISAYEMAANVHQFQTRNDGSPYFWHPTRVARILIEELSLLEPDLIAAALLHDTLEDSGILTPEVLEHNFGAYTAYLVESLTKEIGIKDGPLRAKIDEEYIDKLNRSSEDARLIKLADRLDNLRCLEFNLKKNPYRYVKETLEHYVPMAESSANLHMKYLLREIRKEQNRYFG